MKTMKEISAILTAMTDSDFEILNNAEYDAQDVLDRKTARNGRRRLAYNLKKFGLTVEEWDAWCTE